MKTDLGLQPTFIVWPQEMESNVNLCSYNYLNEYNCNTLSHLSTSGRYKCHMAKTASAVARSSTSTRPTIQNQPPSTPNLITSPDSTPPHTSSLHTHGLNGCNPTDTDLDLDVTTKDYHIFSSYSSIHLSLAVKDHYATRFDRAADTRVASRADDVQGACAILYISIVLSAWK